MQSGQRHAPMGDCPNFRRIEAEGMTDSHGCSSCYWIRATTNRRQTILGGSHARVGEPG